MADRADSGLMVLVRPAVFGAFDGIVTVLGALFALAAHPHSLVVSGIGLAAAGAVSMGGGQLLSDNRNGWRASVAIGAATGVGTTIPVLPYTVWSGAVAASVSAVSCLAAAGGIAWLKTTDGDAVPLRRTLWQTYSLLLAAGAATLLCAWLTGAVG
jgi:VIT1/CCC1 family predicted Fe2+/Mn2+ transporter